MHDRQAHDIHILRRKSISEAFEQGIGRRVFLLIPQYPFMMIGRIDRMVSDFVVLEAETTNINELDGRMISVHIDQIEVFYIEGKHGVKIPRLDC
ncbi:MULTISPECIES: hypothetical protein [unclassified Paenibacillus]|uniref:hypothetical protein n=1 Tax=unclassified Paenibacillus TaxID=185978 RepID=UPI001AE78617|nr:MULTISPECIES: hypothetical protein [unclassified Paenibacillus]MBP1155885.1 hypothetical protein [Paenibacillus sp. PvP091]MBP1168729.1 hypothetical protein [Paenibacillus sp. PvR098]MBP2439757.1 hypothetical protein [Paenibacillus sp. PvP052]